MSRPMIVNRSGKVFGDDGKQLYGMDAELHFKMKAKEDPEWEKKCCEWVSEVTGEKFDHSKMFDALSDGVILIKLVNILKPGAIAKYNTIDPNNPRALALAATGNIRLYLGAVQAIGVPGVDMFLVEDLRTGRSMSMVCRNLASLSRIAARDLGWTGPVLGPRLATPGPKTWKDVEFNPYQHVDEIPQSELEEQLLMYKGLLEKEHEELVKAMSSDAAHKHEVEKLKKQIKAYKMEAESMMDEFQSQGDVSGIKKALGAFKDPSVPDYLQKVEKSDKDELEAKSLRRSRNLLNEKEADKKSSDTLAEWQKKSNKIQRKMKIKQERRMSFTEKVESPNTSIIEDFNDEDDGGASDVIVDLLPDYASSSGPHRRRPSPSQISGTPSKERRGQEHQPPGSSVGRKALIVIIIVEAIIIAGLGGSFAWYALR